MNLYWLKYFIAGIIFTGIIFFTLIAVSNIVINQIPLPGMEKQLSSEMTSGLNHSFIYKRNVSADEPGLDNIITEEQAWESAWSFYHNKGLTLFLPLEKRSLGLHMFTDQGKNQTIVWGFNVIQNDHSTYFFTGCKRGGIINVDAHSGNILSFYEVC